MGKLYVTAIQNSGGSYGHRLTDVAAAYLFAEWLGGELLADKTWGDPFLEPFNITQGLRPVSVLKGVEKRTRYYVRSSWYGMRYEWAKEIEEEILQLASESDVLFVLKDACRVTLANLRNWYHRGKIDKDVYTPVLHDLRERFYERNPEPTGRLGFADVRVACFIRRAFMAYTRDYAGNSIEFYKALIAELKGALAGRRVLFTFFTQEYDSDDVKELAELPGVNVIYGGDYAQNMRDLAYADIYVGSHSSSSTWAAYFSTGVVLVPTDGDEEVSISKQAMKGMDHVVYPENFIPVAPDGTFSHVGLMEKLDRLGKLSEVVLV